MGRKRNANATGGQRLEDELAALRQRVAELEQTESRFRELVERSPQAVVIHERSVLWANAAAARLFGYASEAELIALPDFRHLYAPASRQVVTARREARLRGEPVSSLTEVSILRGNGETRTVLVTARGIEWDGRSAVYCVYTDVSEFRRIEAEQAQSRQLLRTVLDAVPQWVVVKDRAGRNVLSNRALLRDFGLTGEDLFGTTAREIGPIGQGEADLVERTDQEVLDTGRTIVVNDFPYTLPDGNTQRRHLIKAPLRDAEGEVTGLVSVSMDLTDQWQAQQRLRDSEERLRTIVDHLPVLLVTGDAQGVATAVEGAGAEALHGLGRLLGRPLTELLADQKSAAAAVRQALAGEAAQAIWQAGERAFDARFVPLRDDRGEVGGVLWLGLEVTERLRAQHQAESTQALLQTVIDTIPHWIVLKDREGRFRLANRAIVESFGLEAEQWMGRTVDDIGPQESGEVAQVRRTDQEVLDAGREMEWPEYPFTLPGGTRRVRHMIKTPVRDGHGEITGVLAISMDRTEELRQAAELRAQRLLLQTVIDSIPLLVFVKDREGRYLLVNRTKLDLYGVEAEELIGRPFQEVPIATPEQRERMRRSDLELFNTGERQDQPEMSVTLGNGETRVLRQVKLPLRDEAGEIFGLVGVAEDITEQQRAQEEFNAQRRLLQAVFDVVPVWLYVKDRESRFLMVNETMARQMGQEAAGFSGMLHPAAPQGTAEQRARVLANDQRVIQAGENLEIEEVLRVPGGGDVVFRSRKVPLRNESGNIVGLVGMSEDVTERRKADEELRRQRRLLQTVFDTIPTWLFVKDREGRFVMVNDLFARDVGRSAEGFQGLPHERAPQGSAEQRAKIRADEEQIIATGMPYEGEEELNLPDGTLTYRFVRKVPLRDDQGEIVGIVGISEDITGRRKMEEQIRRMQRIESIGTLAGGIAHDFNNILFPILGFTELTMLDLDQESGAYRNLTTVRDAAMRAKDIVAQILAFSRQAENKPEVVQMRPLIHESLRFLGSTLPSTVHIEERLDGNVAPVYADAVQMHQVLMNLCVNAAHAMPEGGTLRVSLRNQDLQNFKGYTGDPVTGPYVRLAVEDTGTGIDTVTVARIFEPFFTTKPVGHGTGLGLSTVLGIVSQHKGVINVVTAPGEGALFEVFLPAVDAPPQEEAPLIGATTAPACASILYVDDEPDITELACMVLGKQGHRVMGHTSSRRALESFLEDPAAFDLLITDQTMPELTGDRLATAVRTHRPDLPIVIGTGDGHAIPPGVLKRLEIAEVFVKPITGEQLARIVERVLQDAIPPVS